MTSSRRVTYRPGRHLSGTQVPDSSNRVPQPSWAVSVGGSTTWQKKDSQGLRTP